jgi:hypothetical protein
VIAARNLCAAVARKSIIVSQDRMNGASLRASFLGMAQGLNKAPLCTNIEALIVEMDFLRATAGNRVFRRKPLGGFAGTQNINPVQLGFLFDRLCTTTPG